MFRALAQRVARPAVNATQKRGMAKAVRLPGSRQAVEDNVSLQWLSDPGAYPVFGVMAVGGGAVLAIWYHAWMCPDVQPGGTRGTLNYIENEGLTNNGWGSHRGDSHLK
jgi:hypothetical protein